LTVFLRGDLYQGIASAMPPYASNERRLQPLWSWMRGTAAEAASRDGASFGTREGVP